LQKAIPRLSEHIKKFILMSKFRLFLFFCLFAGLSSFGLVNDTPDVLKFDTISLNDAFKKAKQDNKLVFILVTSKDCAGCKRLEKDLLKGGEYVAYYQEHFYNFSIKADDMYHQAKLQGWGVSKVPTLLYLNGDKKVVHIAEGYDSTSGFQYEGEKAVSKAQEMLAPTD
jgi:thioredoxin-related protein